MRNKIIAKATAYGILAATLLLGFYFLVLTLVSGWGFANAQFSSFWYFILSLAAGFGIQIGLYAYLKNSIHARQAMSDGRQAGGKVLAVSGTTSTAAMISCCAHYLVNILPVLGTSGLLVVIGQYQAELFWISLAFNLFGIGYIADKVIKFKKSNESG